MVSIDERRTELMKELVEIEIRQRVDLIKRLKSVLDARADERGRRPGVQGEAAEEIGVSGAFLSQILKGRQNMSIPVRQWMEGEEKRLKLGEPAGG
jgi:hypothetical protein